MHQACVQGSVSQGRQSLDARRERHTTGSLAVEAEVSGLMMLSPVRTEARARQHHLNQLGLSRQHGWRRVEASVVDLAPCGFVPGSEEDGRHGGFFWRCGSTVVWWWTYVPILAKLPSKGSSQGRCRYFSQECWRIIRGSRHVCCFSFSPSLLGLSHLLCSSLKSIDAR